MSHCLTLTLILTITDLQESPLITWTTCVHPPVPQSAGLPFCMIQLVQSPTCSVYVGQSQWYVSFRGPHGSPLGSGSLSTSRLRVLTPVSQLHALNVDHSLVTQSPAEKSRLTGQTSLPQYTMELFFVCHQIKDVIKIVSLV